MSKIQLPPGTPPSINPTLAKAAADAATTKKELNAFLDNIDVQVLKDSGGWDEFFALHVPDRLLQAKYGVSPATIVKALHEKGVVGADWVYVSKNLFTGNTFVHASSSSTDPAKKVEDKWVELSPRSEADKAKLLAERAAKAGVKVPAGERAAALASKLGSDPHLVQVKDIFSKTFTLQKPNGQPTDPNDLWKQVLAAAQVPPRPKDFKAGDPEPTSKLAQLAWALAGAFSSKNGEVDWAKTQARATMIEQGLIGEATRNLTPGHKSLEAIAAEVASAVKASHANPAKPTAIGAPTFKAELEALTGGKLVATEAPELIGNGRNEDALAKRLDVLNGTVAGDDINYAMWKFYPDAVGTKTSDALAAAAKRGVKVNVLVDGNVSSRDPGEQALIKKMRDAGCTVVESQDKENPMNGMHAKMILVNCSKEALAKGRTPIRLATDRNDGTQYLMNPKADEPDNNNFGWSGSDLVYKGSGAAQGLKAFANMFNVAAARAGQPGIDPGSIPSAADLAKIAPAHHDTEVMSISDVSGPKNPQSISKAIEKLADGVPAGQTISIDHAYFMGLPGIEAALKRAIERGVNLEVVTNSSESCDVPGISSGTTAIFERLTNAAKTASIYGGGQVALHEYAGKQTLHDKSVVFGDQAMMRMSWNQHGRSQELECEDADVIFGKSTVAAARANFAKVVAHSRLVSDPKLGDDERQATQLLRGFSMELM